jgi:formylglycine-generating enzyme required for sulfatase activity
MAEVRLNGYFRRATRSIARKAKGLINRGRLSNADKSGFWIVNAARSSILIPEMAIIPSGTFKMGSNESHKDEKPVREVTLSAFMIGRYEVTNKEYLAYLEATGQNVPEKVADPRMARYPVVLVSWHDAVNYCKWLSNIMGMRVTLPTEAQGEYAARPDGRKYPWGNNWELSRATFNTNGTRPVDAHPTGVSPFGIWDLSGNVSEWRLDWYDSYNPKDLIDPRGPRRGVHKVIRGGAWFNNIENLLRSYLRLNAHPEYCSNGFGFRVAVNSK